MSGTNATTSWNDLGPSPSLSEIRISTCGYSRFKAAAIEVSDPLTETLLLCRRIFSTSVKSKAVPAIDYPVVCIRRVNEDTTNRIVTLPAPQAARGSGHSERSVPREPKLKVGENRMEVGLGLDHGVAINDDPRMTKIWPLIRSNPTTSVGSAPARDSTR